MKVIIIEDVEALAASLAANLRQLRPDVVISAIAPDTVSAIEAIRANPDTDLIFADIRLEDGYSFDVFDAIETNAVIVFITAYDEYALKAFDYECIDYLLKPYRKEDLEDALRRFEKRRADMGATVRERDGALKASPAFMKRLEIYRADSSLIVDVESICYAEYDLGSVHVYCKDRVSGTSSLSLTALAAALAPDIFMKISRVHIVNINEIASILPTLRRNKELVLKAPYESTNLKVTAEVLRELKGKMTLR